MAEWYKEPKLRKTARMELVPGHHRAVAHKFYSDPSLRVWRLEPASRVWVEIRTPRWGATSTFFVGKNCPTPITLKESCETFFVTDKDTLAMEAKKYRLLLRALFSPGTSKAMKSLQAALQTAQTRVEFDEALEAEALKVGKYVPRTGLSLGRVE